MSTIFCDTHCLNCTSLGKCYVNFCMYHRLCDKCAISLPDNAYSECIHCRSIVLIVSDNLEASRLQASTIDETQSEMDDSLASKKIILEEEISLSIKEEQKTLKMSSKDISIKFIKNKYQNIDPQSLNTQCDHCRNFSYELCTVYCSHLACELCIEKESVVRVKGEFQRYCTCQNPRLKVYESGIEICITCKNKFRSPAEKNVCNLCRKEENLMYSNELDYICEACFNKACFFCLAYDGSKHKKTECSLCIDCKAKVKEKHDGKNVCDFCFEYKFSSYQLACGHSCCEFCSPTVESCLKCMIKNNKILSKQQQCYICTQIAQVIKLICGHFVCVDCKDFKILKRLNYCCIVCCLTKQKRCIKCKKLSKWTEEGGVLKKICCNNTYCRLCLKKLGFIYKSCECIKNRKKK